jgi:hypothetical protein
MLKSARPDHEAAVVRFRPLREANRPAECTRGQPCWVEEPHEASAPPANKAGTERIPYPHGRGHTGAPICCSCGGEIRIAYGQREAFRRSLSADANRESV